MGFLGFGRKRASLLIEVIYEGPDRLRLNGNRISDDKVKRRAISHDWTVCWIEYTADGIRKDQGTGPAAEKLGAGAVDRLLRELPQSTACHQVLDTLIAGHEQTGRWLQLGSRRLAH